jgi:hypothetical protein
VSGNVFVTTRVAQERLDTDSVAAHNNSATWPTRPVALAGRAVSG